jgi:D-glycero-D-manno-heptose 1,7-bisphosphate phosphatase
MAAADASIDVTYFCPHHPDEDCNCRKPGTALFQQAAKDMDIDFVSSFIIGNTEIDIRAGKKAG